jgi:anti-sigma factor RsiW
MRIDDTEWERLSAYVDGELPADEAAEIAARLVTDRELAAQVAALTRLKAEVKGAFAPPPQPLPVIAPPRPASSRGGRLQWIAAAAAVAALAFLWWPGTDRGPELQGGWLKPAIERHAEWRATVGRGDRIDVSAAGPALGLGDLGRSAQVLDFSDAGLQVSRIEFVRQNGLAAALHVGYVGNRGCRVSLWIGRATGSPEPVSGRFGGVDVVAWRVDDLAYALLASGLDSERFQLIARSAREATMRHRPIDPDARVALQTSRDTSTPCAA